MADENKSTFKDKLRVFWSAVKRYAKRVWEYLKVAKMEYIVMLSLFAFDLITKAIINATMEVGDVVTVIPYVLNFHNVHNSNAAFGAGFLKDWFGAGGSRIFFCVFAVAASVVFILILIRHKGGSKLFRVALAMLVAGAMGNCIDRWALAYVRDFVEFVYFGMTIAGKKTFYVFNIADAELVIGVVLVIIYFIFVYKDKSSEKKLAAQKSADAADGAALQNGDGEQSSADGETENKGDDGNESQGDGNEAQGQEQPVAEQAQAVVSDEQTEEPTQTSETDGNGEGEQAGEADEQTSGGGADGK